MKSKREILPGNVYKRGKKLWIRYKSERFPADAYDTPQGWEYARAILRKRYLRDLESSGAVEKRVKLQTIGEIFEEYIADKTAMGYSYSTVRNARLAFSQYDGLADCIPDPEIIEKAVHRYFVSSLHSDETRKTYLRNFRAFCRWAEDNKKIPRINFRKYDMSSTEREFKEYTFAEYRALLKHFLDASKSKAASRYAQASREKNYLFYVMLLCMSQIGARRGETVNLRISQIDFTRNTIIFTNKVKKQEKEKLVITRPLEYPLQKAVAIATKNNYPDNKLFPWNDPAAIGRRFRRAEKALGIEHIPLRGFHAFRKGFSERLFRSEMPLDLIQQAMRHKNITTTIRHYKKRETERLRTALSNITNYTKDK